MTKLDKNYYKDPHTLLANLAAFPDTMQEVKGILEENTEAGYLSIARTLEKISEIQTMTLEMWAYVYYTIHCSYPRNGKIYLNRYLVSMLPQYENYHLYNLEPLETFMTEAQLKEYAPANILRREKARRVQALRDADLSTIKLDTFSYTLFINALKASGRITIKDSLKYFNQLDRLISLKDNEETQRLVIKYIRTIFDATRNPNKEVYLAVQEFQHTLNDGYCKDMPFVCVKTINAEKISIILEELKNHTKVAIDFSSISRIITSSTGIVVRDVLNACNIRGPFGYYMSNKITGPIAGEDIFEYSYKNQKATIIMYTLLLHTSQFNETLRTSAWFKLILDRFKECIDPAHEDMRRLVESIAQLKHYFTVAGTVMNKMEELHAEESLRNSS
ncbi:MAG: hypothetical protein LR001_05315 [Clostridiales bacterium]|nr:hypothetical protein [Clostridiales bacterium]